MIYFSSSLFDTIVNFFLFFNVLAFANIIRNLDPKYFIYLSFKNYL